jgi:hypothetical protein
MPDHNIRQSSGLDDSESFARQLSRRRQMFSQVLFCASLKSFRDSASIDFKVGIGSRPMRPIQVTWRRKGRWVHSGKFWTSAGVSAGMDGALALIAYIRGAEAAKACSLFIFFKKIDNVKYMRYTCDIVCCDFWNKWQAPQAPQLNKQTMTAPVTVYGQVDESVAGA